MADEKEVFDEDAEMEKIKEKKQELAAQPVSFEDLNAKFLKKQVEMGSTLQDIATDFAKSQAISSILNEDTEEAEKTRKELKDIQKETLKESFRQDNIEKKTETIDAKQKRAESFYKSFRPILEFDFSNLIKKKEKDKDGKFVEEKPKTYQDRSYGIPLMLLMLFVLTIPYILITIFLSVLNGVNAILEEISTFGKTAKVVATTLFVILVLALVVYCAICGVEKLFAVSIIHK